MAAQKVNTSKSLHEVSDVEISKQVEQMAEQFRGEKKVKVTIPKALAKHIGPTLFLSVNGSDLVIPVDGKTHEINETHAAHLAQYLDGLEG